MESRVLFLAILLGYLTCIALSFSSALPSPRVPFCRISSPTDYILGFRDRYCPASWTAASGESVINPRSVAVTEGDERWLQMALYTVHKKNCDYVALLFYASWCPFSKSFRPTFDVVSSFYFSIPHFAMEESTIRPSILSKYEVHGFPTLFLLNSTMRVRYRGSRSLGSLVAFYSDVTGIKTLDKASLDKKGLVSHVGEQNNTEQEENCWFTWARSPENLLRQETYLALATIFVLSRLLYLISPTLLVFAKFTGRRLAQIMWLENLSEHPAAILNQVVQFCKSLKRPCKRSNFQEGAMNARAWASKSLATVSIGDSSSSRGGSTSQ